MVKTVTGFLLVVTTVVVFGFHGQPVLPVQVVADVKNGEVMSTSVTVAVLPSDGQINTARFVLNTVELIAPPTSYQQFQLKLQALNSGCCSRYGNSIECALNVPQLVCTPGSE